MSRMLSYAAAAEDAGQRLDALMAARGLYPSRSVAARAADEGLVFVNGAAVAKKHLVAAGDTIVYQVEEAVEAGPLSGQPIDLDIRYEDDALIVLSKQVGLVCHPSVDHDDGTLVNALIYHCGASTCATQGRTTAWASCTASTATRAASCWPRRPTRRVTRSCPTSATARWTAATWRSCTA